MQHSQLDRGLLAKPWTRASRIELKRWLDDAGDKRESDLRFAISVCENRSQQLASQVALFVSLATFGIALAALFASMGGPSSLPVVIYVFYTMLVLAAAVHPVWVGNRNTQNLVKLYDHLNTPGEPHSSWFHRFFCEQR